MKRVIWPLVLVSALLLTTAGIVFALFVYDTPICAASWDGVNYTCTLNVTTLSPPDHKVCIMYRLSTSADWSEPIPCSGSNGPQNPGLWTCLIPTQTGPGTVYYDMSSYTSGDTTSCGEFKNQGPSASFDIGPNAITLTNLNASGGLGVPGWVALAGLAGVAVVLAGGAVLLRRRAM